MSIINLRKYRNGKYDGFETSEEILAVIEHVSGDDILSENSRAASLWHNGFIEKINSENIIRAAWEIADECIEELDWGVETFKRPRLSELLENA